MEGRADPWSLVPVVLLRHAGFPFELVESLADLTMTDRVEAILDQTERAVEAGARLRALLRTGAVGQHGSTASGTGMLKPLTVEESALVVSSVPPESLTPLRDYQTAVCAADETWSVLETDFFDALAESRRSLVSMFEDPALRGVLLLSNDARYSEFSAWLDGASDSSAGHLRRMTDLLAMYVQRIATKNETHSYFGPLAVGRVADAPRGISWEEGPLELRGFWSHWAADELAESFGRLPGARDHVRPRRRPMAFLTNRRIRLYDFVNGSGAADGWRFVAVADSFLDDAAIWLWQRCDGTVPIGELREDWSKGPGGAGFNESLSGLAEGGWILDAWEIPVGDYEPLRAVADHLARAGLDGGPAGATVRTLERLLTDFSAAAHDERPALLDSMKKEFRSATGTNPNRSAGRHYADRSVFYEEAYSPVRGLTLGADIAEAFSDELAVVYEVALLIPRLRFRRETEILRRWVRERFGAETPVPLMDFYERFFRDMSGLSRDCEEVDREIDALDREMTSALLDGADSDRGEVVVDRERLRTILDRYPTDPPALCNPDIMICARDKTALADGDFRLVVGDCHAVREVLTHSSFAPLIQGVAPDLVDEVYGRYLSLLDDDEVLLDVSRSHPDKTAAALVYPCPDLEARGLSPKARDQVLHPSDLYVIVHGDRLELRSSTTGSRVRLMAPLAGGPSIRQDPLSPFSFPRHHGGIGLRGADHDHIPRIRVGRLVLLRERWRIPATEFRGWSPGKRAASTDVAEFTAARRLRRRLMLPRFCFAMVTSEPKPIFVDWASPLLVRQLFRYARKSDSPVVVSEMLPSPEELWLDIDGKRHTSELRCAVFSPAAPTRRGGPRS